MPIPEHALAEMERYLAEARALDENLRQRLRTIDDAVEEITRAVRRANAVIDRLTEAIENSSL